MHCDCGQLCGLCRGAGPSSPQRGNGRWETKLGCPQGGLRKVNDDDDDADDGISVRSKVNCPRKAARAKGNRETESLIIDPGLRCYLTSCDKILINLVVRRSSSMRVEGFLNEISF